MGCIKGSGGEDHPLTESSKFFDSIEGKTDPHEHPEADRQQDLGNDPTRRRAKITLKDLQQHDFSPECPRCELQIPTGDLDARSDGRYLFRVTGDVHEARPPPHPSPPTLTPRAGDSTWLLGLLEIWR